MKVWIVSDLHTDAAPWEPEVPDHDIQPGARLALDVSTGAVGDETADVTYRAAPLPPIMLAILEAGGLVPYLRRHGDYVEVGGADGEDRPPPEPSAQ